MSRGPRLTRCAAADVRLEVFVDEQNVPFVEEIDARDFEASTIHLLARGADGTPLATGRILLDPEHPGRVHLGRLAVRRVCRGTGLGARMVAALEEAALEGAGARGDGAVSVTVVLAAQERAMGFYGRCGYEVVSGESYLDAGIPHQDMAKTITRSGEPADEAPSDGEV
ncbi:GNAT family N-acetyltransferase [Actinomyces marmotae]|uniref:GNAT family N-acetyltransferase n=1 Tax=Actinomyces marmotae TaxID=2737173 RepID=A0A6M8B634_9ACTO|nr:GNAT family N-acetyltransferase [Actinomyces marmotae]QKD79546.1 GNAT family N-acetyltransferase [Actinomyces marmotae]